MIELNEDRRAQLLQKSKNADNYVPSNQALGKNRYQRRVHSKVMKSVSEMNNIDMDKFFKDDILDVSLKVKGETDEYTVRISFGDVLEKLQEQLKRYNNELTLRLIIRALVESFNDENVYIRCSCPDFQFRFSFWLSVHDIIIGQRETRPADITNPHDTKGAGCKHILLCLSNNSWITKVGSVIYNYINYMKKHQERLYADVMYPAIYGSTFVGDVQLDIDTSNDLVHDKTALDTANKWAKTRTQFRKGNEYRFQKQPTKPVEGQLDLSKDNYDNK